MADLDDIKDGKDFHTDKPQTNTLFALKGCGALDWGMQSRLARIFNPKTRKTVMLAFDHGYFQGPTTGLERIDINIAPLFEYADVLMCLAAYYAVWYLRQSINQSFYARPGRILFSLN